MGQSVYIKSVTSEPDGGFTALANAQIVSLGAILSSRVLLARWRADGTPDAAFGIGGVVSLQVPGSQNTTGNSLLRSASGAYLIAGWTNTGGGFETATLFARVLSTGTLDPTFGTSGFAIHDFNPAQFDGAVAAVETDAGFAALIHRTGVNDFFIAGFVHSGALDATFGTAGVSSVRPGAFVNFGTDLARLSDGSMLATGWAEPAPGVRDAGLVKWLANGMPDGTFGPGGIQTPFHSVTAEAITPDGSGAVIVGRVFAVDAAFAGRALSDGAPDTSFTFSGVSGRSAWLRAVIATANRLYAAGETVESNGENPLLIRMMSNGSLDTEFGDQGNARLSALGTGRIYGIAQDSGGKVLVAGSLRIPTGSIERGFVARVQTTVAATTATEVPTGTTATWILLTLAMLGVARFGRGPSRWKQRRVSSDC